MRSQPFRIFGSRFAMALLAALAFQPSLLSAQGGDVQSEASNADKLSAAVLKASELAKLNRLLRSWYLYEIKALSILNRSEAFGRKPGKKNRQKSTCEQTFRPAALMPQFDPRQSLRQ